MQETTATLSRKATLHQLVRAALESQTPLAIWRKPGDGRLHAIVQWEADLLRTGKDLEEMPAGFAFCPFESNDPADVRIIQSDLYFAFPLENGHEQAVALTDLPPHPFAQALADRADRKKSGVLGSVSSRENRSPAKEEMNYVHMVHAAIDLIRQGKLHKVVPSRRAFFPLAPSLDYGKLLFTMASTYPSAMVSLVYAPETGLWMGATPELLVRVEENRWFTTASLAGTQPKIENQPLARYRWTQKEIEEQAMVSRYIINCFKTIRLREFEEIGPRTVIAGDLAHLLSTYRVDMQQTNFKQLGSVMLRLLHPTSAVCGMPKESALDFLQTHEHYPRDYYSGFLGPVHFQGDTHIYVNLRCMQMMENGAWLYAGAGVTSDSVAEEEWEETEWKLNTMASVLHTL